ncbi:hypothetical protein LOK74_10705 [Brevibacillus humidisoli]|uniref:CD1247 N-terminal domain-containing protein n=1 Tax=Brevibacillus humidisoli TaxID=2895522 RepID=UPI001E65360F|nr:CD1247 N-terminal domain-containing protein [Brevibacillus humidisoli]UFJ42924.1 hypothetical protein LOK74_10705 [Brevibacillus humidisoli]
MEQLEKRISYLRGLADGFDVSETSREGKVLVDMIQVIDDMVAEMKELHVRVQETEEYLEAVDEDLSELEYLLFDEEALYEVVDEEDEQASDEFYDDEYYDLDDSEDAYIYDRTDEARTAAHEHTGQSYEIECPTCREVMFFHEGIDDEGYRHYVIEPLSEEGVINPT